MIEYYKKVVKGKPFQKLKEFTKNSWVDVVNPDEDEVKEHTEWHNICAWKRLAELSEDYLNKGSKIFVEGRLRNHRWEDKEGVTRNKTEVNVDKLLMLDPSKDENKEIDQFIDEEFPI